MSLDMSREQVLDLAIKVSKLPDEEKQEFLTFLNQLEAIQDTRLESTSENPRSGGTQDE